MLVVLQPGQTAPEMAAAAAAAAVVREAAANAVTDVLDAGESEEEKTTKLAMAKEDKMRKVIRSGLLPITPHTPFPLVGPHSICPPA